MKKIISIHKINLSRGLYDYACLLSVFLTAIICSGCFTGIESTKKIELGKEDRRSIMPTEEDKILADVEAQPLKDWNLGKPFMAADDKVLLLLENSHGDNMGQDNGSRDVKGNIFRYAGIESRTDLDGSLKAVLLFSSDGQIYKYNTSKNPDKASVDITSSGIPFLIDVERVEKIKDILIGKTFWTQTHLWYDADGNRVAGKKFVPVKVTDVVTGDAVFPVRILFTDDKRGEFSLLMNYSGTESGSRRFKTLFSISDPRLIYRHVSDEAWLNIQNGTVALGMTKEECRISLGSPSELDTGHTHSTLLDVWRYSDGRILRFADGVLVDVWR